jgi:hypothetical protein
MPPTLIATLVVLVALLFLLAAQVGWGTRAARARNAFLVQRGSRNDFLWTPPAFPVDFKVERRGVGPELLQVVDSLGLRAAASDWACAVALASHLTEFVNDRGPIRRDPVVTYRAIRAGFGYCADHVKVFLALAHAAGLFARQWAFSFDGFGGHGHTIVEIFDRQRGRWLMIDVFNNFHVVDAGSGEPMSALAFRDALLTGRADSAAMRPNGPGRPGYVHPHKALEYYRRGLNQWYMWWGNAVLSYYAHPAVSAAGRVSRTLPHAAGNLFGVQPRIRILETPENARAVERLFALRRRLGLTVLAIALLVVLVGLQLTLLSSTHMDG